MIDLLSTSRGLGDVIGADAVFTAGSKVAWNGWVTPGVLSLAYPSTNDLGIALYDNGFLFSDVQVNYLSAGINLLGSRYLKVVGTLAYSGNLTLFYNFVEGKLGTLFGKVERRGVCIDYAAGGSDAPSGSCTTPIQQGGGGSPLPGGNLLDCFSSGDVFNCLAAQFGVTTSTAIIGGVVLGLVGVILVGKLIK